MTDHLKHIPAIQDLIFILEHALQQVKEIGPDLPDGYRIRASRSLEVLVNSSRHAIGQNLIETENMKPIEFPPITNFLGREIVPQKKIETEVITKESDEFKAFYDKCEMYASTMSELTQKQFYDLYTEFEIRGVAKFLGMDVTNTEPEVITTGFIEEMFQAYEKKRNIDGVVLLSEEEKATLKDANLLQSKEGDILMDKTDYGTEIILPKPEDINQDALKDAVDNVLNEANASGTEIAKEVKDELKDIIAEAGIKNEAAKPLSSEQAKAAQTTVKKPTEPAKK